MRQFRSHTSKQISPRQDGQRSSRRPRQERRAANPLWRRLATQPKVTPVNDASEREADRVADRVLRMPDSAPAVGPAPLSIQRMCDTCEEEMHRMPSEDEEEEIQTKAESGAGTPQVTSSTAGRLRASRGQGEPLPAAQRAYFEPRFGRDFSRVRLHSGGDAARSATEIRAQAFAYGRDIYFGRGQSAPETPAGRRLLAHELTHVVQQGHAAELPQATAAPAASATPERIAPYRWKKAELFDKADPIPSLSGNLAQERFYKKDKNHPLIEKITVHFSGMKCDSSDGCAMPFGDLEATYKNDKAFKAHKATLGSATISMPISGGTVLDGLTDRGKQTVCRIEGQGYVSSHSRQGKPGELTLGAGEEWSKSGRYVKLKGQNKPGHGNMDFGVFFNRTGTSKKCVQAIHGGALDIGSLACVHAGTSSSDLEKLQQINYHSQPKKTKVDVTYDSSMLLELCAHRLHFGDGKIGGNPCNKLEKKAIKAVDKSKLTCTGCS